jgi:hypothetical protein
MSFHPSYLPMLVPGGGASGGSASTIEGVCEASLQIGQFVYLSGNTVAGKRIFSACSALVKATLPAVGIVASKPTSTTCKIATVGVVTIPASAALMLGQIAYVGVDGFATSILLTTNPSNVYLQRGGTISKPTEIILNIQEELRIV